MRAMVSLFDICERRIGLLDSLSDLLALVQQCLVTRAQRGSSKLGERAWSNVVAQRLAPLADIIGGDNGPS